MDNVSLRSLRTRQNIKYDEGSVLSDDMVGYNVATFGDYDRAINEHKSDITTQPPTQPPRPPRVEHSRHSHGHRNEPRVEYYTPEAAVTPILQILEPHLLVYTQGKINISFFEAKP